MGNFISCKESLKSWLKARIPFVTIKTKETSRALRMVKQLRDELNIDIYYHDPTKGMIDMKDLRKVSEDRSTVAGLEFANERMLQRQNLTFVFTEAPHLDEESDMARSFRNSVNLARDKDATIIVLTHKSVWPELQSLGMSDTLGLPDEDETLDIITDLVHDYKDEIQFEWTQNEFSRAASILTGLMETQIESILYTRIVSGALRKEDIDLLTKEKDKIFSDISGIERVDVPSNLNVGGLTELRKWLDKKRQLLTADLRARKMRPPRGVLLVGVPGCGKSLSAKTIALEWKMPLYRLDISNIHGMYVGQSESRLKSALEAADNVSPCILWIDEIEKGLSGMGGSSGVTSRLVGHFLFWLQESTKRVFVVATANDVSMLPAELLRRGRFDELFFVDLPNREDREEIIKIYLNRYLPNFDATPSLIDELIIYSQDFAGSDIEAAIKEIGEIAFLEGDESISPEHLVSSFKNSVPLIKTNPEKVEAIRRWGSERALPASKVDVEMTESKTYRKNLILGN